MTNQTHPPSSQTLEAVLAAFVRALQGSNRSPATVRAYQTDVSQFLTWLHHTNVVARLPTQVERADITDYLGSLAARSVSGGIAGPQARGHPRVLPLPRGDRPDPPLALRRGGHSQEGTARPHLYVDSSESVVQQE